MMGNIRKEGRGKMNVVDIQAFKKDVGLDEETLKEMYLIFSDELNQEKGALHRNLSLGLYSELAKTIHNIKGISSGYRAHRVYDHAKQSEAKLSCQDYENIDKYIGNLTEVIEEAVSEITKYFEEDGQTC